MWPLVISNWDRMIWMFADETTVIITNISAGTMWNKLVWNVYAMQSDDLQCAFSLFRSRFVDLFDKYCPKRNSKWTYSNRKPWLTSALKQSLRNENRLYARYKRFQSSFNEWRYRMYRNKLSSLLKNAEKTCYAELLESNKSNLKETWNILKHIVSKKIRDKMQAKFKLADNSVTDNKFTMAENLFDYLVNIGHNLSKHISSVGIFPRNYLVGRVL